MKLWNRKTLAMILAAGMLASGVAPNMAAFAEDADVLESFETDETFFEENEVIIEETSFEEFAEAADEESGIEEQADTDSEWLFEETDDEILNEDSFMPADYADAADTRLVFTGDEFGFYKEDMTSTFGMLTPQDGSKIVLDGDNVRIYDIPSNTTVYGWLHWGLITDAELTKDVVFLENGHVVLSVGKENCGYGLPVAPIKKKDGGTTSSQYYLCIPSAEKIPQIADYTGLDAALAAVPEDLGEYTEESAKAVTDAVAAVSDPIFRYKSEAEQADIDAAAQAITDAVAALERPAADTRLVFAGDEFGFYKEDMTSTFGMLTPQDGSKIVLDGDNVRIYDIPSNTTVYGWLHWGLITDAELTKDVAFLENGHVVLSVGKENCGYGLPVAPIKKKDGGTTSSQYYLCIPSAEKIPQIADYTGLDAALAAVPEDLGEYTEESAKAVTDAVAAVSDPIFRYKSEAEQADIDAAAQAITDAVAALERPAADTRLVFAGDEFGFYKEDMTSTFGMLTPQDGSKIVLDGDNVRIYDIPSNTTVYGWLHWGLITDAELTKDVAFLENGHVVLSVGKENCGYGLPVAPIKKKDGGTTSSQYYLCIPSAEKIPQIADYTGLDAALAAVPEDLGEYTEESAKAVTDAVAAVSDPIFRYKSEAEQADIDAAAQAITDAVAALERPAADTRLVFAGDEFGFYKEDMTSTFGMLTPQDGSKIVLDGDNVRIYDIPSNTTVYGWLHWGFITDAELTKDVAFLENGHVVLSVGKENCGYGLPVAPIKKKDGGTTSSQYYLCIPSAEKIPQIADYTGLDAALAAVPEDLGEYTEESAKAVTDAVAAVSDPIFRYKSEAEQADIDTAAQAITDAVAALVNKEDQAAADAVSNKLAGLKADAGISDKAAVEEARAAYDALTDAQKALVDPSALGNLKAAEESVKKAEEAAKKAAEEAAKKAAEEAAKKAAEEAAKKAAEQAAPPAAGTVLTDGTANYVVETPGSTVAYQGPVSKKVKKVVVPNTVAIDGVTYTVDSIAPNAFRNCKNLTNATIPSNITSIGANAFAGTKNLKNVTIKSKQIKKIGKKAFYKSGSKNYKKLKVKVPKSKLKAYRKLLKNAKLSSKAKVTK